MLDRLRKGFTLLEVLISLVIISLLVGVIFGIYTSILKLSVRIEQEKNLNNELLFASQTIQNIVDSYDLDLSYYFTGGQKNDIDDDGYTNTLAMVNQDKSIKLKKVGECNTSSGCFLGLEIDQNIKQLTNPYLVHIPNLKFRIIPHRFTDVEDIYQKGFRIYGKITSSRFNATKYELNVAQDIQMFFDIRKY